MPSPFQEFRLRPAWTHGERETIHLATANETSRGSAVFRAPTLPTPQQLNNDLPFTVNLRPRFRQRPDGAIS